MSKYEDIKVTITVGELCAMRKWIEELKAENKKLRDRVNMLTMEKCRASFDWPNQPSKHYLLRCKK